MPEVRPTRPSAHVGSTYTEASSHGLLRATTPAITYDQCVRRDGASAQQEGPVVIGVHQEARSILGRPGCPVRGATVVGTAVKSSAAEVLW